MNGINNIFNKNEIENKLKDFKEGQDYSVAREGKKLIYNFHNNWLRDEFGRNWTTVYEVAENWDSDNFNHHREEGKYINNDKGTEITYRYEHRINKDLSGYREWSWGQNFEDNSKATWILRGRPNPKKIENGFNDGFFLPGDFKNDEEIKHQERLNGSRLQTLERDKKEFEEKLAYYESLPAEERKNKDTLSLQDKINFLKREIEEEKDWINSNNSQQKDRTERNERRNLITDEDNNQSDLRKENQELKQQLSEVQKQLAEVLEELKKIKNNSVGQVSENLEQQIVQNERLIKEGEKVSVAEVQEQVNKSQALMKEFNNVSSTEDNKAGNGSFPYVVGGSVILVSAGIIGYFLLKKNRGKKVA